MPIKLKEVSHTRLWSHIGYAVATIIFAKANWNALAPVEYWFIYLAIIGGSEAANGIIRLVQRRKQAVKE